MIKIPARIIHKKIHKIYYTKIEKKQNSFIPQFGTVALKAQSCSTVTGAQLDACFLILKKNLPRKAKIFFKGMTSVQVTKKPLDSRMGKGVGAISYWIFPVKRGRILFEIRNVSFRLGARALFKAALKLSFKTKICI